MTQKPQNKSHAVYVAFHIAEDVRASGESARILSTVEKLFGEQSKKAHEVPTMEARELVVGIDRPIMSSEADEREFYKKLRELFQTTAAHTPHFTHVSH